MAGCYGNTDIDRYLERQVDDYYDRLDDDMIDRIDEHDDFMVEKLRDSREDESDIRIRKVFEK